MNRYQRFKEILTAAAADSSADYGRLGQFWNLPLEQLLNATLFDVRLIAPDQPPPSTCCGHSPAGTPNASRSQRSALIAGLRGESPFDGIRFPRLPWGGSQVSDEDVDFIAQWIDDGCPAAGSGDEIGVLDASGPIAIEREGYAVYEGVPNEYKHQNGELRQRVNLDCMTPSQLENLRCAFRELYELNKWPLDARNYNNLALIHQNHCQHGWERFLPWHRIYMYEFEKALQDQCSSVTMPYWDWTLPQYPANPIPNSFQAYLTDSSLESLAKRQPSIPAPEIELLKKALIGNLYATPSGFFDAVTAAIGGQYAAGEYRNRFIDALLEANPLWYPLRYPGQFGSGTINSVIHYHYPSADDIDEILNLRTFRDFGGGSLYNESFGFLDQNPHNTLHIWTGGLKPAPQAPPGLAQLVSTDRNKAVRIAGRKFHTREDLYTQPDQGDMLSNLTASNDPIFWPVHSNVDRLWFEWQQAHPDSPPTDLDAVLTPWGYTVRETLDIHRFGYEYVKSSYVIPVGAQAPVGRFVSKALDLPPGVRAGFRQAEVRLHRVPQLPRSCFVRVFLNLPDANASVPLTDEHYAGYVAIFGHGDCYGGPGHCEVPSRQQYDLRPRDHNTPRNHRVNVTKCARRLIDAGATSFQITLVVIGADYIEENELLRLDGVSLNFLD
jgi:tyrosinase